MNNRELQNTVLRALDWEPSVDATKIGVSVEDGVVTLRGEVRTFAEKSAAERVSLRVYGVKAVANDIEVRLDGTAPRSDTEIAHAAVNRLKWSTSVPKDAVTVAVRDGWITLAGSVEWGYQANAAARILRDLAGVRGVTNDIQVKPHATISDIQAKIEAAFRRSAEIDARRVTVDVADGKVILSGSVHSLAEREEARRATWAAPGVSAVEDRLSVVP